MQQDWHQEAIKLSGVGLSHREISEQLRIPKSTIGDYLRKVKSSEDKAATEIVSIDTDHSKQGPRILVIPDTQCKPGISFDYLSWIGEYAAAKMPDVIVHLGDHADLPSLSSYDKGKKGAEGRRVSLDIQAAIEGMNALLGPIKAQQSLYPEWKPRLVMVLGNHDQRLIRYIEENPELDGFLGYDDLKYKEMGWEVYDFLDPAVINGVTFVHYFPNAMTGKPLGGSAQNMLQKVGKSIVQGHRQCLDVATRTLHTGEQQWSIVAGACLTPDHKVLTSDLRYVQLGDVEIGQKLISFDEERGGQKRSRRWKEGAVLAKKIEKDSVYEVLLQSGKRFKVTNDHKWFTKLGSQYIWKETRQLRIGTCIPKLLDEWEQLDNYDAGWLSGLYDGEGCLSQRKTTGGFCFQLSVVQKEGKVLEKIKQLLDDLVGVGNTTHTRHSNNCTALRIKGGVRGVVKVLGQLRPIRLLPKFIPDNMGSIAVSDLHNDKVVSIKHLGEMDVVRIDIDAKTMVVEGYGHHNCYEHEEKYKGYVGNNHWRGMMLLNDVQNGSFDPTFVSMDYLKRRYSNEVF